jgi:nitrile hydratase
MGGQPGGPIDTEDHVLSDWEVLADGLNAALGATGLRTTDEMRRIREDMPSDQYLAMSYYERWLYSMEEMLIEKGVLTREEIDRKVAQFEQEWGEP